MPQKKHLKLKLACFERVKSPESFYFKYNFSAINPFITHPKPATSKIWISVSCRQNLKSAFCLKSGRIRSLSLSLSIGREIVTSPKFARIRLTLCYSCASFFLTAPHLAAVVVLIQSIFRVRLRKVRTLRSRWLHNAVSPSKCFSFCSLEV